MAKLKSRELRAVITYPRDAVLDAGHLVVAFGVSEEIIASMDLPCTYAGARPKYVWGQVVDELQRRAHADARPRKAS